MKTIALKTIALPAFDNSGEMPAIPVFEFESRIKKTLLAMKERGLDFLLVFADREHFANFSFLTNLDPRFEEALLLLDKNGRRKILFGNECMAWATATAITFEYELFQDFSLLGQDRSKSKSLEDILKEFRIGEKSKVGGAYYKYYTDKQHQLIAHKLDIPTYLSDALRDLCGDKTAVVNANDIFMDSDKGLRNQNCLEELVRFEWASVRTSESMKRMIRAIKPEVKEYELANQFQNDGIPYSCHPMLSTGAKARYGLSSPSDNVVEMGDAFTSAFGLWGALTCRAGMIANGPEDLQPPVADYFERFWRNYFLVVATWYESIGIGVGGGVVMQQVENVRDQSIFDFALNAGHTMRYKWILFRRT
ncbi:MAG: hypothetical protein IPP77_06115 [Bacteroidetes bacterium]|nr:hypothetical protein [Bacteroidota bacterium]